jgi:cytochrome b subunit of formate dehydrogenase
MTSFLLLVITGFALRYSHTWWAQNIVDFLGGWEMRANIHHIAGITMVALGLYHFLEYFLAGGKARIMFPRMKDLEDFWSYLKFHLGAGERPKYDRFEWKQKFEYWGVVWGTIVMGLTGFILMFPFVALKFLPYAWFQIAAMFHFYEALLATLVVFIWHFYNVHFNPEFPLQTSFITGRVSEKMMKEEHQLVYESIMLEKND